MQKQIEVAELGQRAAEVVDEVVRRQESYIVARDGAPEAVLISYFEFLRLQPVADAEVHERFDRMIERLGRLNAGFSAEEIARDVAEAIAEVRRGQDRSGTAVAW